MHEFAIAQNILAICLEHAKEHHARHIQRITLQFGQMTGVEPEALKGCFALLADRTMAAGAELYIVIVPLTARCQACEQVVAIEPPRFFCPVCNSTQLTLVSGREMKIEQLEVT
jgi:hydrogenase nickel incorporation protein HypA/HybF